MHAVELIADLVLAVTVALIGGAIAQRLRQPVIVGYLLAGAAIGAADFLHARTLSEVPVLAEIGVAFLMFTLGVEFNLRQLQPVRKVAVAGGLIQILMTILAGTAIGVVFGFDIAASIFFSSLVSLSSTVIVLKVLAARGELGSIHGQIAIGLLIVQDLSVVPMMIVLPELKDPDGSLIGVLAVAAIKAAILLAVTYLLGTRVLPRVLAVVAGSGSRELFLLCIFSLALGTALLTQAVGLSLAFGAFVAGLVISESEFSYEAIGQVSPIRDLFATLFFVSVGMLIDPRFIIENFWLVGFTVVAIIVFKFTVGAIIPIAFGYSAGIGIATGVALAQIGEFSFVLAQVGFDSGILSERLYSLALTAALVTMVVSPFLIPLSGRLELVLWLVPGLGRLIRAERGPRFGGDEAKIRDHVIICGYGRVGQELAEELERRRLPYVIIELNPHVVARLRAAGIPYIYGDSGHDAVLEQAQLERARLLVLAIPDAITIAQTVRLAREFNPLLPIIARSHSLDEMRRLRQLGADEAVLPEFEAGLELIRHCLWHFGVGGSEIQATIRARRAAFYEVPPPANEAVLTPR